MTATDRPSATAPSDSAGPYSIGSDTWPGVSKVLEEAGEIIQVLSKLIGAGGVVEHWDGTNLRDRITEELGDLKAAIRFFEEHNDVDTFAIAVREQKKFEQFVRWHQAAR